MAKLRNIKTSASKQNDGVWCEHPSGARFLIARAQNENAEKLTEKLKRPHLKEIRNGTVSTQVLATIGRKVAAETILLGWEGIEDDQGKEWTYSIDHALEILTEQEFQDLAGWVLSKANDETIYQNELDDDSLGN
jgi:hypothetical protein